MYTAQIMMALGYLHERDTLYRDLKPDNVVLDGDGHAILIDFGLSKEAVGACGTKSFCGSVAFLAPEIIYRKGHNHTVDIYTLGVLLFDMLTGLPPFYHPDRDRLFANIKHATLEVPHYVARSARDLILAMMVREPKERLGSDSTYDIMKHDYFSDLDFDALMRREIPVPFDLGAMPPPRGMPDGGGAKVWKKPSKGKNGKEEPTEIENWDYVAAGVMDTSSRSRPSSR